MAPTSSNNESNNSNNNNNNLPQRPDRKEMVLLLWRDFSMEMVQLDMIDIEAKAANLN